MSRDMYVSGEFQPGDTRVDFRPQSQLQPEMRRQQQEKHQQQQRACPNNRHCLGLWTPFQEPPLTPSCLAQKRSQR